MYRFFLIRKIFKIRWWWKSVSSKSGEKNEHELSQSLYNSAHSQPGLVPQKHFDVGDGTDLSRLRVDRGRRWLHRRHRSSVGRVSRQGFVKPPHRIEHLWFQHHRGRADQAKRQTVFENISWIFLMLLFRIHPNPVTYPDFIGITGHALRMGLHPTPLNLQFNGSPPVIWIQKTNMRRPSLLHRRHRSGVGRVSRPYFSP